MMPDEEIITGDQSEIDACKKRLGANPKSLRLLWVENSFREFARNFQKLHDALENKYGNKTLVLIDGAEL